MASDLQFQTDYLHSVSERLEQCARQVTLHLRNQDAAQLSAALNEVQELLDLSSRIHALITAEIGRMPASDAVIVRNPPRVYDWSPAP